MKMEERDRIIQEKGKNTAIQSYINANRYDGIPDSQIHTMLQKYFQLTPEEADTLLHVTE